MHQCWWGGCGHVMALQYTGRVGEWVRFRLRTLLAAISLKEPVFTGVLHCLASPANLDGVLKELERARNNQLEMMHALSFVMQYRTACAPPGPSLR